VSLWRTLGLGVAAVAALYAMQHTQPSYARLTGPFTSTASHGQRAAATRHFEAEISGYRAAQRLKFSRGGKTTLLTTDGIWVLMAVKAKALAETLTINAATWEGSSGLLYYASDRAPGSLEYLTAMVLQPGLEGSGVLIFEIPREELRGASLLLARNRIAPLAGEVRIPTPDFGPDRIVEEFDLDQ
jgi:hypothetical protein